MTDTMPLSDNARTIFDKRYSRKDEHGGPTETPEETVLRVVMNVASINALYAAEDQVGDYLSPYHEPTEFPKRTAKRQFDWLVRMGRIDRPFHEVMEAGWLDVVRKADAYRDMLLHRDFFPNSPTWTGAGTELGQLAACFVLPIEDDLGTSRASIFETLRVAALIQQTGGGNGFSFGRLRPNKALVTRSMGKASGPVGFLYAYDAAFGWIAQGGTRRGANMGVLPVHHPDIRGFIAAKIEEGHVENFNISVAITDEFMEAVEKDADFTLRWSGGDSGPSDDPVDYEITETIRARDLYDEIIANAWKLGDPGNLFIDKANATNPCPSKYVLEATNPCGEQWLPPYSNCCLGSINLANFAKWSIDEAWMSWDPVFDWAALYQTIHLAQNFLDDVVDANQYVPAVPELEEAAMNERRIGLGIMGLADAMAVMGVGYDTERGREFAAQVMEFVEFHTMMASALRARERGPFEWYEDSIYNRKPDSDGVKGLDGQWHPYWVPPTPLEHYQHDFGRPYFNWADVVDLIRQHGLRNACYLTIAPTGTISNVADLGGSGGEPFFALAYDRILTQDEDRITLTYANPLIAEALRRSGKSEEDILGIALKIKENKGSCRGIPEVPFDVQDAFPCAADVSPEGHVRMQAVLQRFVDNSISKTINMPFGATEEDVSVAYRLAYSLGCKGITIYRQGSRQVEVLSTGQQEVEGDHWPHVQPHPIPDYAYEDGLPSRTFPVPTPFGTAQVYITELREHEGRPFDVRVGFGKAGNDKLADVEAMGRMISTSLRAGVPVETVVDQLEGIGGQTVAGFGPRRVRSVADGIAKLLRRLYMPDYAEVLTVAPAPHQSKDEDVPAADPTLTCPYCNQATVINDSGCQRCDVRLGGCGDFYKCD